MTSGPMTLTQEGAAVKGPYAYQDRHCTREGRVKDGRLAFTYREPDASGEGSFELDPDHLRS